MHADEIILLLQVMIRKFGSRQEVERNNLSSSLCKLQSKRQDPGLLIRKVFFICWPSGK